MTDPRADYEHSLALQRVILEGIDRLENAVESLGGQLEQVQREIYAHRSAIQSHSARLDRLRVDKQIVGLPSWLWNRLNRRTSENLELERSDRDERNLLVIAPKYPSLSTAYGGQPVERRVSLYRKAGFRPEVVVPVSRGAATEDRFGVKVHRVQLDALERIVNVTGRSQILVHHPEPDTWDAVKPFVGKLPVHLWIHGYEARDWRDAEFGTSDEEMAEKTPRLDALGVNRRIALAEAFIDERVTKIFVSNFMKDVATRFVGVEPTNAHTIHNVIDTSMFAYQERKEGDRLRILTIKSYASRTYATDLVRAVIDELSTRPFFEHLQFEIRGDGILFEEDTRHLKGFDNVSVVRGIVEGPDVARLMSRDGILLNPTRLDTQGITAGEAMSCGMAVVTNAIAAIPEFIDEESGLLTPPEGVVEMADAIERLYHDPALFLKVSEGAARRVREQCGPDATVARELSLFIASGSYQPMRDDPAYETV